MLSETIDVYVSMIDIATNKIIAKLLNQCVQYLLLLSPSNTSGTWSRITSFSGRCSAFTYPVYMQFKRMAPIIIMINSYYLQTNGRDTSTWSRLKITL